MKSEVIPKLEELELQLNYVCYNKELIPMLQKVWNSFYDLKNEIYKLRDNDLLRCEYNNEYECIEFDSMNRKPQE